MSVKKRKVLGRGLGALLKPTDNLEKNDSAEVMQLSIDTIALNPRQPRQTINEEKLDELARSIKAKGVIQPILVRPNKKGAKKYEVVAGERRLLASKLAGFKKIPGLVRPVRDEELLEIALIENIQRDDLNPIEESKAYQRLLKDKGYTQDALAKRIGKNRSTITNLLRLLQLPESIQDDVAANILSIGHARTLLSLKQPKEQVRLRDSIVSKNLSVRKTEEIVRSLKNKFDKSTKDDYDTKKSQDLKDSRNAKPDSSKLKTGDYPRLENSSEDKFVSMGLSMNIPFCQQNLIKHFEANVSIRSEEEGRGKIEFEFDSMEDFQRIYSLLLEK